MASKKLRKIEAGQDKRDRLIAELNEGRNAARIRVELEALEAWLVPMEDEFLEHCKALSGR